MVSLGQDNSLIVGAGDNNIHVLDLEHGVFKVGGPEGQSSNPRTGPDRSELVLTLRTCPVGVAGSHGLRALCERA